MSVDPNLGRFVRQTRSEVGSKDAYLHVIILLRSFDCRGNNEKNETQLQDGRVGRLASTNEKYARSKEEKRTKFISRGTTQEFTKHGSKHRL